MTAPVAWTMRLFRPFVGPPADRADQDLLGAALCHRLGPPFYVRGLALGGRPALEIRTRTAVPPSTWLPVTVVVALTIGVGPWEAVTTTDEPDREEIPK